MDELDPNKKYVNDRLSLRQGSYVESALAETKARTNALTGGGNEGEYVPVDTSSNTQTAKNQTAAYGYASDALKAGSGSESESQGSAALQGGLSGAAAGGAMSGGNPYAVAAGAAIGALSGIMNAKAKGEKERIEAERAKATAMAENIRMAGVTQQNAMTNMQNTFTNILAPRKA